MGPEHETLDVKPTEYHYLRNLRDAENKVKEVCMFQV